MVVRIWKVGINRGKSQELEKFANEISLPMLRSQQGCLGVLFTRTEEICATITFWKDQVSIDRLDQSASYQEVVEKIEKSGILGENHETEVFPCYGGYFNEDLIQTFS